MSYLWETDLLVNQRKLRSKVNLRRELALKHPLEITAPNCDTAGSRKMSAKDILGDERVNLSELDPLTRMSVTEEDGFVSAGVRSSKDTFEPWTVKKMAILSKFTTQEKLSITTSVYSMASGSGTTNEMRGVSEKVLHRLEQLDLDTGARQFYGGLTQDEYTTKINQLDQQLAQAWQADMRVNALKIGIQCCKLLNDTSVIYFYPSKFVIITDILDKFGNMVYTRLRAKKSDESSDEVAKEMCKNWFFKVGSIRELLPRILIELAILKSSSFITPSPDYGRALNRLLSSMWGLGCPVVAIYMRCYLCRVAMELVPDHKELYMQCFQDLLLLHDQVLENFRNSPQLVVAKVSMDQYVNVLLPAVDWILQCLVHRGEHLHYTLHLISSIPLFWKSVLMSSLLTSFPPSFIADQCPQILEIILTLETNLPGIIRNLGMCLLIAEPQADYVKDTWKAIWPQIKKIFSRDDYFSCCQVWVEFMIKHFNIDTTNEFLEDVLMHVSYLDVDHFHGKLSNIVEKLLTYSSDITLLLTSDPFVKLVSMLGTDAIKQVLLAFNTKHVEPMGDALLVNTLMHLGTTLHDSVDALTPIDEIKQIGSLINGVILRISYGRDFEKQLQFYDEARGSFTNIDSVLTQLVHSVCRLGMSVRGIVEGHHTKRTKGFLSACLAYAFITVPSLDSVLIQLQLYLIVGQVAYANQCLSQGDACLKAAISLLNENMPELNDAEKLEFVSNLLSTLLVVPDHPKEPVLYLLRGLMSLDLNSGPIKIKILSLLGAYAQETYPYGFDTVDSNNSLYGGSESFISDVNSIASAILNDLLSMLKILGDEMQIKKQSKLCLDLFTEILHWGNLNSMGNLALNLWNLSKKAGDQKLAGRMLESVRRKSKSNSVDLQNLVTRISVE